MSRYIVPLRIRNQRLMNDIDKEVKQVRADVRGHADLTTMLEAVSGGLFLRVNNRTEAVKVIAIAIRIIEELERPDA